MGEDSKQLNNNIDLLMQYMATIGLPNKVFMSMSPSEFLTFLIPFNKKEKVAFERGKKLGERHMYIGTSLGSMANLYSMFG